MPSSKKPQKKSSINTEPVLRGGTTEQGEGDAESVPLADYEAEKNARLRIAADYANLERRVEQERAQIFQSATATFLEKLFPIFDNFYRSSAHAPEVSAPISDDDAQKIITYLQGVKMIEKQMEELLAEVGLRRIITDGEAFDPSQHEAVSYEPSKEIPADHVIGEIEVGWILGEKVLRPAKVRVSQG